ncbi:hypothetical protein Tco_1427538 [Tanacetum coccineum]
MENTNPSSSSGSPTSPISRKVQKHDMVLESVGKNVPPPTIGNEESEELEEEVEEEFKDEEEEDDLEYFNTFPTREELEYHE